MAKLLKTKSNEKLLSASKEKKMGTFRKATIRMLADFSIEMMKPGENALRRQET